MNDLRKLDLNLVVLLDALLSERNLTRAGELVGMTQPAVSGALARLRETFDDPLLKREGRGFVLTPRALALAPLVTECMVEVQRTFDVLPEFDPATSTRVFIIAASDYALSEITSPLLRTISRVAPHTRVEFFALPAVDLVSPIDLLRHDVTIAGTGRGVPGKRTSLFSDEFVCLADAANPALKPAPGGGYSLTLEDIARLRHVRSVFGPHVSTLIDDTLNAAGIEPRVALTVQGFLPVAFAIARTRWIGWVPARTAARFAESLNLVTARTPIVPSVLVEAAHWHPSKTGDPAIQWLLRQLRAAAEVVEFGYEGDSTVLA